MVLTQDDLVRMMAPYKAARNMVTDSAPQDLATLRRKILGDSAFIRDDLPAPASVKAAAAPVESKGAAFWCSALAAIMREMIKDPEVQRLMAAAKAGSAAPAAPAEGEVPPVVPSARNPRGTSEVAGLLPESTGRAGDSAPRSLDELVPARGGLRGKGPTSLDGLVREIKGARS